MAAGDVHRLNDIEVEEVSLVDRAANKRKFLLVKREEGSMGEQLVADGRGGFTVVKAAEPEEEETTKAKPPPFPPKKPDAPGAKKPDDKEDDDKEDDGKKKKPFPGAAKPFGKAKDGKEEDDKEDDKDEKKKPWEKAEKVDATGVAAVANLRDLCEEMLDALDDMDGEEEAEPSDKKKKAEKVVEKILARRTDHTGVAKAGRKMSAARLDKLKSALTTLDALIKEVDGALSDETKTKAAKAAKEVAVDDELKKSVATLVEQTAKVLEENETLRKSVTDLSTENATLKKSVPAPNSGVPGENRAAAKKADDIDPPWPMNMNPKRSNRITKGGVKDDKDDDSFL